MAERAYAILIRMMRRLSTSAVYTARSETPTAVTHASGISGAGGGVAHFAHLGGLAAGYGYLRWRKRRYFRQWKPVATPKAQVVKSALRGDDRTALDRWKSIRLEDLHELNRDEVERLLVKASEVGASSLTPDERAMLDRFASRN